MYVCRAANTHMSSDYDPYLFIGLDAETLTLAATLAVFVLLFLLNRHNRFVKNRHPWLQAISGTLSISFVWFEGYTLSRRLVDPFFSINCNVMNMINVVQILTTFAVAHHRLVVHVCRGVIQEVISRTRYISLPSTSDVVVQLHYQQGKLPQQASIDDMQQLQVLRLSIWYRWGLRMNKWPFIMAHLMLYVTLVTINFVTILGSGVSQFTNYDGAAVECNSNVFLILSVVVYLVLISHTSYDGARKTQDDAYGIYREYKLAAVLVIIVLLLLGIAAAQSRDTMLKNHLYLYTNMVANFLSWVSAMIFIAYPIYLIVRDPLSSLWRCKRRPEPSIRVAPAPPSPPPMHSHAISMVTLPSRLRPTLEQLTTTPQHIKDFKLFLTKSLCVENYIFYERVIKYADNWSTWIDNHVMELKANPAIPTLISLPVNLLYEATGIYDELVRPGSELEVNLPSNIINNVTRILQPYLPYNTDRVVYSAKYKGTDVSYASFRALLGVFESSKLEIYRLMSNDSIPRYILSDIYLTQQK